MTIMLDHVVRCGDVSIAAVTARTVRTRAGAQGVSLHGLKTPIAILLRRAGNATAIIEINGSGISAADLERRYTALRQEFERLLLTLE